MRTFYATINLARDEHRGAVVMEKFEIFDDASHTEILALAARRFRHLCLMFDLVPTTTELADGIYLTDHPTHLNAISLDDVAEDEIYCHTLQVAGLAPKEVTT